MYRCHYIYIRIPGAGLLNGGVAAVLHLLLAVLGAAIVLSNGNDYSLHYTHVYVCMHICMYVCMCIYIYTYIYI